MGEVASLIEAHGENRVARLDEGEIGGQVRIRAGVRLDIGVLGTEQFRRPQSREILHLVGYHVPAVVAQANAARTAGEVKFSDAIN
jgi:hypothetical protein